MFGTVVREEPWMELESDISRRLPDTAKAICSWPELHPIQQWKKLEFLRQLGVNMKHIRQVFYGGTRNRQRSGETWAITASEIEDVFYRNVLRVYRERL